jgi:SagB-type dehydrogenase family enzyme
LIRRYRRSPHLVCFWERGRLVFENYARRSRVSAAPLTCEILDFFTEWRPAGALTRRYPHAESHALARAIAELVEAGLLDVSSGARVRGHDPLDEWALWSPAASYFHFSTKDAHGPMDPAATMRRLRRRAKQHPMPPPTKQYAGRARVALPPPRTDGELARTLLDRRTWRTFARRPIDIEQLATLLGLTFGVRRWKEVRGIGRLAAKTSPSGGSRHPIEAYVLALRVRGLRRGVYHYDSAHHRLERLRGQVSARQFVKYLNGQTWFGGAAIGVIMTAVFARTQWKYQAPRAYRAVLIEAGHVCQTLCLVATSLGLAPFCTMALADSMIERGLDIDGASESALYAAGVGTRPAGMDEPPWGIPLHPLSPSQRL